jgi:ribonuclease HI
MEGVMQSDNEKCDVFTLMFDGCSKGNPGKAGAGAVIYKNNIEIWNKSLFISDKQTNNYAEYMGLIIGLQEAIKLDIKSLVVKGDSLLIIKQMKGEYNVKSTNIIDLHKNAVLLIKHFKIVDFMHIYRKYNKRADALSNEALL